MPPHYENGATAPRLQKAAGHIPPAFLLMTVGLNYLRLRLARPRLQDCLEGRI